MRSPEPFAFRAEYLRRWPLWKLEPIPAVALLARPGIRRHYLAEMVIDFVGAQQNNTGTRVAVAAPPK